MNKYFVKCFICLFVFVCLFTLPALAAPSGTCPDIGALGNFVVANNVAVAFSNDISTNKTTYKFISLTNENPVNGLPGLVKYCVYPDPTALPTLVTALATGANGALWKVGMDPTDFAFMRPNGEKSNIPLNGKISDIGTATWTSFPSTQIVLLHISDSAKCASLYGGTAPTCFVLPNANLESVCDLGAGSTVAAYNAIPYGGVNCAPPSVGVEAYGFNEFGDQVTLAASAPRKLVSLNVLFTSYGCSQSGHWYSGDCITTAGATFQVPITARIYKYDAASCSGTPTVCPGPPLATFTKTQTVPYRPSADSTNCGGTDPYGYAAGSRWFNPLGNGGAGSCQYSIATVLTFDFSSLNVTLPEKVVWTVAYNTSHSGYEPIAQPLGAGASCESSAPGCGYDSLNVGIKSYTGAPYAGTDDAETVVFLSWWKGGSVPQYPPPFGFGVLTPTVGIESTTDAIISGWTGYRPLGEIITTQ